MFVCGTGHDYLFWGATLPPPTICFAVSLYSHDPRRASDRNPAGGRIALQILHRRLHPIAIAPRVVPPYVDLLSSELDQRLPLRIYLYLRAALAFGHLRLHLRLGYAELYATLAPNMINAVITRARSIEPACATVDELIERCRELSKPLLGKGDFEGVIQALMAKLPFDDPDVDAHAQEILMTAISKHLRRTAKLRLFVISVQAVRGAERRSLVLSASGAPLSRACCRASGSAAN